MFDLKEFIKENLVNGVVNECFAKENANIMAVNYLTKGILTTEDIEEISDNIEEALNSTVGEEDTADTSDDENTDVENTDDYAIE